MSSLRAKIGALTTFAVAAGAALVMATPASAATTPATAITNDPNASNGTLTFYDAGGKVVRGGDAASLTHMFTYAAASSAGRTGATKATIYYSFPDHTQSDSQNWVSQQQSASTNYPVTTAGAPTNITGMSNPVATAAPTYANMNDASAGVSLDSTPGYQGIVQIRLYDTGPTVSQATNFWATDIYYDANGWQQVYPGYTTTSVSANPNPVTVNTSVTLSAAVKDQTGAAVTDGSVQFSDGSGNIGSPVNVNPSGVASTSTTYATTGTQSITAVYSSTNSAHPTSTGTTSVSVAAAPPKNTAVTLAVSGNVQTTAQGGVLTATVADQNNSAVSAGTVAFYDNGATTPLSGTSGGSGNTFTLTLAAPDFATGAHSIVAKFTPADPSVYAASQSAPASFATQDANDPCKGYTAGDPTSPGTCDSQPLKAEIPVGTITITTPYTAASPLDLGKLQLNSGANPGTYFTSGKQDFKNIIVTDTRSGAQPWTVSALAGNLTSGSNVIDGQNVGLTDLVSTPSSGFVGTVSTTDRAAALGVGADGGTAGLGGAIAHPIATADHGPGTVTMNGKITLNAPTSAKAGVYNGTITFTVG